MWLLLLVPVISLFGRGSVGFCLPADDFRTAACLSPQVTINTPGLQHSLQSAELSPAIAEDLSASKVLCIFGKEFMVARKTFDRIRNARREDLPAIESLSRRLLFYGEDDDLLTVNKLKLYLERPDRYVIRVYDENGVVYGYSFGEMVNHRVRFEQTVVAEAREGRGIGRALFLGKLAALEQRGVDVIEITTVDPRARTMVENTGLFQYRGELLYVADRLRKKSAGTGKTVSSPGTSSVGYRDPELSALYSIAEAQITVFKNNEPRILPIVEAWKLPALLTKQAVESLDRWFIYSGTKQPVHFAELIEYRAYLEWGNTAPPQLYAAFSVHEGKVEVEGMVMLGKQTGKTYREMTFIELAPWNREIPAEQCRYQGMGTELRIFGIDRLRAGDPSLRQEKPGCGFVPSATGIRVRIFFPTE
jgi:hypothetical protein